MKPRIVHRKHKRKSLIPKLAKQLGVGTIATGGLAALGWVVNLYLNSQYVSISDSQHQRELLWGEIKHAEEMIYEERNGK
jgi:hypothetical protein